MDELSRLARISGTRQAHASCTRINSFEVHPWRCDHAMRSRGGRPTCRCHRFLISTTAMRLPNQPTQREVPDQNKQRKGSHRVLRKTTVSYLYTPLCHWQRRRERKKNACDLVPCECDCVPGRIRWVYIYIYDFNSAPIFWWEAKDRKAYRPGDGPFVYSSEA